MPVERWNDGMLDELASSVTELRESTTELRESVSEVKDGIDGLRITAQALLQLAAQSQRDMELIKERQAESDHRFNVLLEEVRFLIRGNKAN
jgi:methyl-accepting chemotaxis protein